MTHRQPSAPPGTGAGIDTTPQARVLDAADHLIATRGLHAVTVAELARRASVSRPTVYRTWSDADDVVRTALARRAADILRAFSPAVADRGMLVEDVLRFSAMFRSDAVFGALLSSEPESFTRYMLQRVGSSQRLILGWLTDAITAAQDGGSIRAGDPHAMAVMLLLIAQSAILSHGTVSDLIDEAAWESEFRHAIDGLLRP